MVFLETGEETDGELVRIDSYNPPTGVPEPEHVHPFQQSGTEVLSGSLRFRIGGEERSVKVGESITIPANTPHNFWNDAEDEAHHIQWFRPALKIDRFFEMLFGLAQDGKLNDKGLPSLLQLAVGVPYFGDEIRLTTPPWAFQRAFIVRIHTSRRHTWHPSRRRAAGARPSPRAGRRLSTPGRRRSPPRPGYPP
jgi:hypothetical protein